MPLYEVGQAKFFPILGRKVYPGETVELPEDVASETMQSDANILKPARRTTQGSATVVRSQPVVTEPTAQSPAKKSKGRPPKTK